MKKTLLVLLLIAINIGSSKAQTPYLLKDIINGPIGGFWESSQYAYYNHPFSVVWNKNGYIYFTAVGFNTVPTGGSYTNDIELWRSDGTAGGTELLKDIYPGNEGSNPTDFVEVNGTLYFSAYTPSSGQELWKTDGTPAGTVMVKDIIPGSVGGFQTAGQFGYGSFPFRVVWQHGNNFYFVANNYALSPGNINDLELWVSDGTDVGTMMVKDIYPGHESSNPQDFIDINGTLYFSAYNSTSGQELWRSDGTSGGTYLVKEIQSGSIGGFETSGQFGYGVFPFRAVWQNGNKFYFVANNYASAPGNYVDDVELWMSDGTDAGTVMVKDIYPGHESSYPQDFNDVNSVLYFTAYNSATGRELWKTDGTTNGTVLIKEIISGGVGGFEISGQWGYSAHPFSIVWKKGNDFYFTANNFASAPGNYTNDVELYKSDGTAGGTVMVKDIYPGNESSNTLDFKDINGTLYFTADDGSSGRELWKSDGSTGGTEMVKDIISGNVGGFQTSGQFGYYTLPFTVAWQTGNTFYFTACAYVSTPGNYTSDVELWKSDGTSSGTVLVKDIYAGNEGSYPTDFKVMNNNLFFTAYNDVSGRELWKTDGTTNGTGLVKEIISGNVGGFSTAGQYAYDTWNFSIPFNIGSDFYFTANDYASVPNGGTYENDVELWKSDGTTNGTTKVLDIYPSSTIGSYPMYFTGALGKIFFTAENDVNGRELWVMDVPVSVEELKGEIKFDVYPNPANSIINVVYQNTKVKSVDDNIIISDLSGRNIISVKINEESSTFKKTIDISNLAPGIYFVKVGDKVKKVVCY